MSRNSLNESVHSEDIFVDAKDLIQLNYYSLCENGNTYEGKLTIDNEKTGEGTIFDGTRTQFVRGIWQDDNLICLHYAQFKVDGKYIRINGFDNLITRDEDNFIARISIKELKLKCNDILSFKSELDKRISVIKIMNDDLGLQLYSARKRYLDFLTKKVEETKTNKLTLNDMLVILKLTHDSILNSSDVNINLLTKLINNKKISKDLKKKTNQILHIENQYLNRNKLIADIKIDTFSWKQTFNDKLKVVLINLKRDIINKIPSIEFAPKITSDINKLDDQIINLKTDDMQLFFDMDIVIRECSYPTESMKNDFLRFFNQFVQNLWTRVMDTLKKNMATMNNEVPLTNSVFLQLFKTFIELLVIVSTKSELSVAQIITEDLKANLSLNIKAEKHKGISEEIHRLQFVVKAILHFRPGLLSTDKFMYKCAMLEIKPQEKYFFKNVYNFIREKFDFSLSDITDDYLIWLYYTHTCLASFSYMIVDEHKFDEGTSENLIQFINSLLHMFKSILKCGTTPFAQIRLLSESIVNFVTTIHQYTKNNPQALDPIIDLKLLLQQTHYLSDLDDKIVNYSERIAHLIVAYQTYWDQRIKLKNELYHFISKEPKLPIVNTLLSNLNTFLCKSLKLKIYCEHFVVFLRSFNELISKFRSTEFVWYVKKNNSKFIKLINADKQSYEVTDVRAFLEECNGNRRMKHYMFEIVNSLVTCAQNLLEQDQWEGNIKMELASDLMLAMSQSFINYSEQPNYEDFEMFFNASTKPFFIILHATSIPEFRKRLSNLDDHTKELKLINLDKTFNYALDIPKIHSAYEEYEKEFNDYIEQHISAKVSDDLVRKIKSQIVARKIDDWDMDYKRSTIPKILAGISAVWSLLSSKDALDYKAIIKPHSIQIVCILRLLGIDQDCTGFENHLAQVLSGEGKSVILALLSTVLAITSNKVRVVCYNEYLAIRDQETFKLFFEIFGVNNSISYGSFKDMANDILNPTMNNQVYNLETCITKLVTGELKKSEVCFTNTCAETVLVIDEVDVFFTPEYYGAECKPQAIINSISFTNIQLKIWTLALEGWNEPLLKRKIQQYIEDLSKTSDDNVFLNIYKDTCCKQLLDIEIKKMVHVAMVIIKGSVEDWCIKNYKLDENGNLVYILKDGQHCKSTYNSYYNIFYYFKLKQVDTNINLIDKNTGYLLLPQVNISYAILPKEFKKILGVTGTLSTLNSIEIKAVRSYNITRASKIPSFFGLSKLSFSPTTDFKILNTEDTWVKVILERAIKITKTDQRAVLIFFDNEEQISEVKKSFKEHISCVFLTGNEDLHTIEKYIDSAGVSNQVTLATRRMSRGVNFKSNDSNVERKGGVHVIQTFFSEDIKEEMHIKGRTARKDNKGSYELILCRLHLKEIYSTNTDGTPIASYNDINTLRLAQTLTNAEEQSTQIKKSQKNHDLTIGLLKQFCNYDPADRNTYFTQYPFVREDE